MLSFFYKKQKLVMVIVFISLGCILFGYGLHSVSTVFQSPVSLNKELGFMTTQGKKIPKYRLDTLTHFLSKESQDFPEHLENWNFLNEGIISKFFLFNKCGEEIFKLTQPQLEEEWKSRFLEEKKFTGYTNSEMPIISVQNVWKKFAESLLYSFNDFLSLLDEEAGSLEAFKKKLALFIEQRSFPGYLVKQVINYQENNYKCKSSKIQGSFNPFNYNDLQDWFGEKFLTNISKIIIEVSERAKKEGFTISKKEIASFIKNTAHEAFKLLKEKEFLNQVTFDQFYNYYVERFFLSEQVLYEVMENILLFKKLLERTGKDFVYDYEVFKEYLKDINQSFEVSFNSFPQELIFTSKEYLNYFETYLELVGEKRTDVLALPRNYLDISNIKKKAPQLVGTQYQLKIGHLHTKELEYLIPLKDVLEWLVVQENIDILNKVYPEIHFSIENITDEYLSLEGKVQKLVTSFIKNNLLLKKAYLIEEKLHEKMDSISQNKYFVSDTIYPDIAGITNIVDFETALATSGDLCFITQDNQNYYLIEKLEEEKNHILSYKDCLYLGILKNIVAENQESKNACLVLDRLQEKYGNLDEETLLSHRLVQPLLDYKKGYFEGELIQQWLPVTHEKVIKKSEVSEEEFVFLSKGNSEDFSTIFASKEIGAYSYLSIVPVCEDIAFDRIFCLQNQVQMELATSYLLSLIQMILIKD